jgi:trimethylguanosine synthase
MGETLRLCGRRNREQESLSRAIFCALLRSDSFPLCTRIRLLAMGRAQRHFAITHSPVVRSFIKPVKSSVVVAASSATTISNPYLPDSVTSSTTATLSYEQEQQPAEPDGTFLIPTQPAVAEERLVAAAAEVVKVPMAGSSDVKGKKRARDEDELVVEYDEAAGTRFGVVVRYTEDNLPEELEKCAAGCSLPFSKALRPSSS